MKKKDLKEYLPPTYSILFSYICGLILILRKIYVYTI